MRIIGGLAKGRRLSFKKTFLKVDSCPLRPTSAKVRKALFDILRDRVVNSLFLDLYAGTGAVGIEALSRGAAFVVFIDESSVRVGAIKKMVFDLGFSQRVKVIKERAAIFVNKSSKTDIKPFDIIFVDPPYGSKELDEIIYLLGRGNLVSDNGVLIVEHSSKKTDMPLTTGCLKLLKQYHYGDTMLSLFIKNSVVN